VHVGKWKLQALLANKMINKNIFLAGDTAHTYTPAGGFGMNCGFQDINHLVHSLHMIIRNKNINKERVIEMYNNERR
jgi:putative polyketide hydroxylase